MYKLKPLNVKPINLNWSDGQSKQLKRLKNDTIMVKLVQAVDLSAGRSSPDTSGENQVYQQSLRALDVFITLIIHSIHNQYKAY